MEWRPRSLAEWLGFKKPPPAPKRVDNPYHAVSIIPGHAPCSAAQRCLGQRFLSRNAPRLPLPTCDAFQCECRFKHHEDRRAKVRRRSDIGLMPAPYVGAERRRTGGRRKEDMERDVW